MAEQEQNHKVYTKKEIEDFLSFITEKLNTSDDAYMHSVLAFNHILRQANAAELFDEQMCSNARDLWSKIRSMGIMLGDPPMLFGLPEQNEESH